MPKKVLHCKHVSVFPISPSCAKCGKNEPDDLKEKLAYWNESGGTGLRIGEN
tara:strand:- start:17 stop:172 length:156 start_codon:yes stop_codon:yes gene_type:complete